jgi:ribosomal silencing factor RsfS
MLLGFGAGSSRFDAKINIRDNNTKELLGSIDVNKMSWLLGGAIVGSQDVKSHMNAAASKIADECANAKKRKVKV